MTRPRSLLGRFLVARRAACTPEQAGLDRDARRRVSGLRRDEVATRAGISLEYYIRLEQGRVTRPSTQVVDTLARALCMDDVHTDYLHRLARGAFAPARPVTPETTETLRCLLSQWPACPAHVADASFDILAANEAMIALTGGDLAPGGNALLRLFRPDVRDSVQGWERIARDAVAAFRFNADLRAPRVRELHADLSRDPDFERIWSLYEVAQPSTFELSLHADGLGDLRMNVQNFIPPAHPGYFVTVYFAEPGSAAAQLFSHLRRPAAVAA